MRFCYPQSFLLHEIEEKGFGETILTDLAVDFYHYSIKRRCRRHYTFATRLLERKIGRDERKTERRRGGWFLILSENGGGMRSEGRSIAVSRINSRLPADSIDGRLPSWNLWRWRPRCCPFGNWSKERARKECSFASGFDLRTKRRDYVSDEVFEWRTAEGWRGGRGEGRRNGKLSH